MKPHKFLPSFLVYTILVLSVPALAQIEAEAPLPPALRIGQPVAAEWTDGTWWAARIVGIEPGRYAVLWEDGERGVVRADRVTPLSSTPGIHKGDRVLACWSGHAKMWPGTVADLDGVAARVAWEDGSEATDVPLDRLVRMPANFKPVTHTLQIGTEGTPTLPRPREGVLRASYNPGDTVAAAWASNSWWFGRVLSRTGDRYHVAYGDGTEGDVTVRDLVPVPSSPSLKVGDRVIACWKGPRMFPGKVIAINAKGFTVQWDDGDTPTVVPAGKIAPF